jgi:hypothetical protein
MEIAFKTGTMDLVIAKMISRNDAKPTTETMWFGVNEGATGN